MGNAVEAERYDLFLKWQEHPPQTGRTTVNMKEYETISAFLQLFFNYFLFKSLLQLAPINTKYLDKFPISTKFEKLIVCE